MKDAEGEYVIHAIYLSTRAGPARMFYDLRRTLPSSKSLCNYSSTKDKVRRMSELIYLAIGTTTMAEAKKRILIATLDHHDGDKAAAARTLNVSLKTVYNLMRKHGIKLALKVTEQ